ncbi:MAG: hypothetical protein SGARI_005320, partial [Bacillariaceae sp.]
MAFAGGVFGSAAAAQYVHEFCIYVDNVDPDTPSGKVVDAVAATGTTLVKTKQYVETECAGSETCTAAVQLGSAAAKYASEQAEKTKNFVVDACAGSKSCSDAMEYASPENIKS